MSTEDILSKPQPPPDERVAYGADANQFFEVRLPRTKDLRDSRDLLPGVPYPVLLNIHGASGVRNTTSRTPETSAKLYVLRGSRPSTSSTGASATPAADGLEHLRTSDQPTGSFSKSMSDSIWTSTAWW